MSSIPKIFLHEKFITENSVNTSTLSTELQAKLTKFTQTRDKAKAVENLSKRMGAYKELDLLSNTLQEEIEDEVKALNAQADEVETERKRLADIETERVRLEEESKNKPEPVKKKSGGYGWVFGLIGLGFATAIGIALSKDSKKK